MYQWIPLVIRGVGYFYLFVFEFFSLWEYVKSILFCLDLYEVCLYFVSNMYGVENFISVKNMEQYGRFVLFNKKLLQNVVLCIHSNVQIQSISTSLPKPRFWNTGKLLIFSFGLSCILPIKKELLSLKCNQYLTPIWRWERKNFLFKKRGNLISL